MKEEFKVFFAAIGYLILAFLVQIIVSSIGGVILGIIYSINNPSLTLYDIDALTNFILQQTHTILLFSSIITILVLIFIYSIKKKNIKKEILLKNTKLSNYLLAFLLGISVWCLNYGALYLIHSTGSFENAFNNFFELSATISTGNTFTYILVVGLVAPFTEEFLFRGVIYRTLNRKFSIITAIIIQGILFGIFHFNMVQGIYATVLGIIFGFLTYKTNSLWPAIICHMTNNISAFVIPFLLINIIDNNLTYIILVLIGIISTSLSIFIINKYNTIKFKSTCATDLYKNI